MNRWFSILLALTVAPLFAESPTPTWEETVGVSPEAVARYTAPGNPERYRALIERLKTPREELGEPSLGMRIPVRSFPNGREEVVLHAEEGWLSEDMMKLRGVRVRVETFDETGALTSTLWADEAAVDREAELAVDCPRRGHPDGQRRAGGLWVGVRQGDPKRTD